MTDAATLSADSATHGGSEPAWRGDGKELFYVSASGKLIANVPAD